MIKIFIDSIINLAFLTTIIFTSYFLINHIQLSLHYQKEDIPSFEILTIFICASLIFSLMSKWVFLAKYYLTDIPSPTELSVVQTGSVNFVFCKKCLNIGITESRLYLSFVFIMRLFHPPLLIPWNSITKAFINRFNEYEIYIDIPLFPDNPVVITLPKKSLEKAEYILNDKSKNKH